MGCMQKEFSTKLTSRMVQRIVESDPDLSLLYVYALSANDNSIRGIRSVYDMYLFLIQDIEEHRVYRGKPDEILLRPDSEGHRYYMDGNRFYISAQYVKELFDGNPYFALDSKDVLNLFYASTIAGENIIVNPATVSFRHVYKDGKRSKNTYKYWVFNGNRIAKDILCMY